jgi:hypothetical protein
MDFFIRQGATDPILKLRLIDDGKTDKSSFHDLLENSIITFNMHDIKTDKPILLNEPCQITNKISKFGQILDEYYIIYRFTEDGTRIKGRFEGVVTIQFLDSSQNPTSKLIVPIREKLYINVI